MKKNKTDLSIKLIIIISVILVILIFVSLLSMRLILRNVQTVSGVAQDSYEAHYVFIHRDSDTDFWDNVYEGARESGEELGIYVEDFGQELTVDYDKDELLEIAIDADVDGIIIDADSLPETKYLINQASQKGIPVVTVMNDCSESDRVCFVGISGYSMGRQLGEQILDREPDSDVSIMVMIDSESSDSSQDLVISGISDVFSEKGLTDGLQIEGIYIDNTSEFGAEEDIRDIFLNDELPDVIIATSSIYTRCLFQAAVDYNHVGDVDMYGFHDSDDILDAVSKNILEGTMSVDTQKMGKSCVEALSEYLSTGYVSSYITQDTKLILENEAASIISSEEAK